MSDFLVQSLLSRSPSPVPSCSSNSSELGDSIEQIKLAQFLWHQPHLLSQFLALCQWQSATLGHKLTTENRKRLSVTASTGGGPRKKHRKLEEDSETVSPVSGMFIRDSSVLPPAEQLQKVADQLDDTAAFVHVSDESREAIAAIHNMIGDCVCALCKVRYDDVFKLAQHKCPRIAHEEYKCPECDKVFSCPANLASHRRWHRPREENMHCTQCNRSFQTRKLMKTHTCVPSIAMPLMF